MNPNDFAFTYYILAAILLLLCSVSESAGSKKNKAKGDFEDENYGVKYASKCEVCRVVTGELEHQLKENFNSPELIHTGYIALQDKKKEVSYSKSMIRLQEALENTCRAIGREYSIHKERKDWTRFSRGQSQTFSTLHGLRNKGVKVDLGMPEEMWDKPSAEVTQLKSQCDSFLETYEVGIEKWYKKDNPGPLEEFLCKKALKKMDQECLSEKPRPPPEQPKKKIEHKVKSQSKETAKSESKEKTEAKVKTEGKDKAVPDSKEKTENKVKTEDKVIDEPKSEEKIESKVKTEDKEAAQPESKDKSEPETAKTDSDEKPEQVEKPVSKEKTEPKETVKAIPDSEEKIEPEEKREPKEKIEL